MTEKVLHLPNNPTAEAALLGSLLLNPEGWEKVADALEPDYFYSPNCRAVYEAMQTVIDNGSHISLTTVDDELKRRGLGDVAKRLPELTRPIPPDGGYPEEYLRLVTRTARNRAMLEALAKGMDAAKSDPISEEGIREILEKSLTSLETFSPTPPSYVSVETGLGNTLSMLSERAQALANPEFARKWSVPTGFTQLDSLFPGSGLGRSDLILLAARPAVGKTTLALNIATSSLVAGANVAIHSLEMSREQLYVRLLSSLGQIEGKSLNTGLLSSEEQTRLSAACSRILAMNVFIDDTAFVKMTELRRRLRALANKLKTENKTLDLVIIDHIQLLLSGQSNPVSEMSYISRSLKGLAKELHVPLLVLSQLNRNIEKRADKTPMLSDLRESGGLEQDSDIVLFIHRPEMYEKDDPYLFGRAEIIVSKNRNGATGTIPLRFSGTFSTFSDEPDAEIEPLPNEIVDFSTGEILDIGKETTLSLPPGSDDFSSLLPDLDFA